MSVIEIYYYIFYKIYKLMEMFKSGAPGNKFRAIMLLTFLEMWFLFSINNYWDVALKQHSTIQLFSFKSIPFIIIILIKWFAFIRNDRWEDYVQEFDQWPNERNKTGTWVVLGLSVLIICSSIISTYLYSNTNN